jgi:hypothetical protein
MCYLPHDGVNANSVTGLRYKDQQFLARRGVVARGDVAHPAIANIETLDYSEAKRSRALDHTS